MNAKQTALDGYFARSAAIHAKLARLQQLADDHFGHDPGVPAAYLRLSMFNSSAFGSC